MSFHFSTLMAYIDPGTGSLVLQAIIAAVVGSLVFFRTTLFRITGWFKKSDSTEEKNKDAKKPVEPEVKRN